MAAPDTRGWPGTGARLVGARRSTQARGARGHRGPARRRLGTILQTLSAARHSSRRQPRTVRRRSSTLDVRGTWCPAMCALARPRPQGPTGASFGTSPGRVSRRAQPRDRGHRSRPRAASTRTRNLAGSPGQPIGDHEGARSIAHSRKAPRGLKSWPSPPKCAITPTGRSPRNRHPVADAQRDALAARGRSAPGPPATERRRAEFLETRRSLGDPMAGVRRGGFGPMRSRRTQAAAR